MLMRQSDNDNTEHTPPSSTEVALLKNCHCGKAFWIFFCLLKIQRLYDKCTCICLSNGTLFSLFGAANQIEFEPVLIFVGSQSWKAWEHVLVLMSRY